jgi:hypothetical protein
LRFVYKFIDLELRLARDIVMKVVCSCAPRLA